MKAMIASILHGSPRRCSPSLKLAVALLGFGLVSSALAERIVVLPDEKEKPIPLFFSANTATTILVATDKIEETISANLRIHQGRPEVLSIGLSGDGEVIDVMGEGLRTWTVRRESDGSRFLDLKPNLPDDLQAETPKEFRVTIRGGVTDTSEEIDLMLPGPGDAVGFSSTIEVRNEGDAVARATAVDGLVALKGDDNLERYSAIAAGRLRVKVELKGASLRPIALQNASLEGRVVEGGTSVSFVLKGEVQVVKAGKSIDLLDGVALSGDAAGEGWFTRLKRVGDRYVHELVGEREGFFPINLAFEAPLGRQGDWRGVNFKLQGGAVVPVRIDGLADTVSFRSSEAVVPERRGGSWMGFLPATGKAGLAWKNERQAGEGALFFSSSEVADLRVGAGLARLHSKLGFQVLQGKLEELEIGVAGEGEILSVTGTQVLAWSVSEADGSRFLSVRLSRPIEGQGEIEVETQSALGAFPAKLSPPRLSPNGTLRHSGYLRIANDGAVRVEVGGSTGLMQLSPGQFPWAREDDKLRQAFVYRFPSAEYEYDIAADQVLPEVSLNELTVHELGETDRKIESDLEIDIREAPLREWNVEVPADFAVASVEGQGVADYNLASDAVDGKRELKILFNTALTGRQLIHLKLEKNLAAAAGEWVLPVLGHPGAKSSRGYIGVVVAPGYRAVPGETGGLAETPPDYFPKKQKGLQQAFRIRDEEWSATMNVEALGQSIQADVFHLYSLKEGAVSASVLVNYFVVGAPASEWRVRMPADAGNVEVTGQNVGRDWRIEEDVLIVPLARPVLGAGTVLVTFEQAMSSRGGELSPGEVRPLDVQSERGHIQVVSPLQVNYEETRSEGSVLKLDASELPAEYRLLSSAPTLAAWQYTADDVSIGMNIDWYDPGETVDQVVDFAKLASHVSRDGQVVTDAHLFVKSQGRAVLRLALPKGADLWETTVDGETANARDDGEQILVPLPAKTDPNEPVEVVLRYGVQGADSRRPQLVAPVLEAPTVIGEWIVTGDDGRRLYPRGEARPVRPVLTETGLEWIASRGRMPTILLLLFAVLSFILSGLPKVRVAGLLLMLAVGGMSLVLATKAMENRRVNLATLEYNTPVVPPGEVVMLEVGNVAPWQAMVSGFGVFLIFSGIGLIASKFIFRDSYEESSRRKWRHYLQRYSLVSGLGAISLGVLSQRMGAVVFYAAIGAVLILAAGVPALMSLSKRRAVVASTATLFLALGGHLQGGTVPAESMIHTWEISEGRMSGEILIEGRGGLDDRVLLLKAPAVLTGFTGAGWRVVKAPLGSEDAYFLLATEEGEKSGRATFEMPLAAPQEGWLVPSGPAAVTRVKVSWNQEGWEFYSGNAAKIQKLEEVNGSAAELVLSPADKILIQARPMRRDAANEETRFYVEVSDLFVPGPGVVSGRHEVAVRPSRGVVRELVAMIPEGFTVGEVGEGPIGSWRFNPTTRELLVGVEPAQEQPFVFSILTQRGTATLPVDLVLSPLMVRGAAGSVGLLGLAFGDEAQAEAVTPEGMSMVNLDDFSSKLLPEGRDGRPLAVLHRAYRHSGGESSLKLKVAPVAAEVRADTKQTLSLGDDRMVLAVDLSTSITRAGLFKLALEIPEGFDIESVTGPALAHWAESTEDQVRLLNLHLNGRTLGDQTFSITLAAPAPGAQGEWPVPRVSLRGAARQTGLLTVVPDRGLQVRSVARSKVSQLDPREAGVPRPGALAFKLLQADWSLGLTIAKLDPWVTAQVLHEVTLREGQTLSRVKLAYRIENAALKSLRVRIPGISESASATLRASGPAVADFVPVAGERELWEIRFQRGVAGSTTVDVEFQQAAESSVSVVPFETLQVRQASYYVALRTGGRLEISKNDMASGWQRSDWGVVPQVLRDSQANKPPAATYRVAEAEGPLVVELKRHDLAESLRLRVEEGTLTTLVSSDGAVLTAVDLKVRVAEKGTLKLTLPDGASLYNVIVNEDGVSLVREGDAWLFHVYPAPEGDRPASVRFVYATRSGEKGVLDGPMLDVPLENLSWHVILPEGWKLGSHRGDFELEQQETGATSEEYSSFISKKRAAGKEEAVALLDQANAWMRSGEQDKAGQALSKAARNGLLDQASNEDARVQLRNLKTQQATLALNTRRQRLYLDNRFELQSDNAQLEQAAEENPLLRGDTNYDPKQFDRLLEGNSVDENAAMKAIANRIVSQQLAADPAPAALDVTLAERGTLLNFKRSVQVKGDKPMRIVLELEPQQSRGWIFGLIISVLLAILLSQLVARRRIFG